MATGALYGDRPPRIVSTGGTASEIGIPNENVEYKTQQKPKTLEAFVLSNYVKEDGTNSFDEIQAAMAAHQAQLEQLQETLLVLEEGPPEEEEGE